MSAKRISAIPGIDPANYMRSPLHGDSQIWLEKNCYIDVWIELLHALGLEPHAMLPFTLAVDFEGDQWTFFKPSHGELFDLYGLDVQEMTVWKPLLEHVRERLPKGILVATEADAFWMPDTAGTDYRQTHTKSTIIITELDETEQRVAYFHNAGYFEANGEDYQRLFRIDAPADPTFMPFFAEAIRQDRLVRRSTDELVSASRSLLQRHLARCPQNNPVSAFAERFESEFPRLQELGLAHYHAWAFASTRQLGAAFELSSSYLRWLAAMGQQSDVATSAQAFESIAQNCKTLILKVARAVNAKRAFDAAPIFADMSQAWQRGMDGLSR